MLPKNLKYQSKTESASAKSFRSNIQPQNGMDADLGQTIILNIPTRANLCMSCPDSYLKFTVNAITSTGAGNALRWDSCGAHGLFQRIRIFSGSNLLEDIDSYGLLAKMLFDLQLPQDSISGKQNILVGTRSDMTVKLPTHTTAAQVATAAVAGQFADNVVANIVAGLNTNLTALNTAINTSVNGTFATLDGAVVQANQINSGESLKNSTGATITVLAATNTTTPVTYCLNLISLVGSLCSQQYLPLFQMTSAPLRIELTLVSNLYQAMNQISAVTFAGSLLSNIEFVASMIELGSDAMSIVQSSLQGQPLQFVVPSWRNYQYSAALANGSVTQIAMPIPAKFSSAKALYVISRDKGSGALTFFPSSCVTNGLTDYTFRVGSQIWPSKAPSTKQEMFAELMKSIDTLGNTHHQPSIESATYTMAVSVANTAALEANSASSSSSGSFYVGIDLENYQSAGKDTIYAGYNTNTDDIFFLGNYYNTVGITARFDAFCHFDGLLVFENGTGYIKF